MGNFNINKAGFVVVGVFVLTLAVELAVWHFGKVEQKNGYQHPGSGQTTQPPAKPSAPAVSGGAPLTPRELQVAWLIVVGRSNKQIAAASHWTVRAV